MVDSAALGSAVTSFVSVAAYLYLGRRLGQRQVSAAARYPAFQFALFWVMLGGTAALSGIQSLVAAFGAPPLALVVTLLYVDILLLCVLLWSLVGYLLYLFTGRGFAFALAGIYAVLYVLLIYYVTAGAPDQVVVNQGAVSTMFGHAVSGALVGVLILILIVPEFVGAISYFTLFFRTRDATVRYRVALISLSLLGWFGFGFVGLGSIFGTSLAAVLVVRSLGVVAAGIVLLAYYPPTAIRDRFGIRRIDDRSGLVPG